MVKIYVMIEYSHNSHFLLSCFSYTVLGTESSAVRKLGHCSTADHSDTAEVKARPGDGVRYHGPVMDNELEFGTHYHKNKTCLVSKNV